jgi:hypothetical protein
MGLIQTKLNFYNFLSNLWGALNANSANTFEGACSEGFDITFFIKNDGTDDLITVFPSSNINFQP